MPAGSTQRRTGEIRSLTGLRGLAACFVVLYHYLKADDPHGVVHHVINHGYIAVDLFFVLSGFVMALTYAPAFTGRFGWRDFGDFLGKRLARVYPLYLVMTAVVIALIGTGLMEPPFPSPLEIGSNVLLVQAWGIAGSIVGPAWSISTEFGAYVIFPVLVMLVLAGGWLRWAAAVCGAVALLVFVASRSTVDLNQVYAGVGDRGGMLDVFGTGTVFPLLRCVAGFVLGVSAFRVALHLKQRSVAVWRMSADIAMVAVLVLLAMTSSDVLLVVVFPLLVVTLATGASFSDRVLGSAGIYFLGEISYSIYLVHRPLESLVRHPAIAVLAAHHVPHAYTISGAFALLLTLPVSAATFYGIEKPARRWVRGLLSARPRPIEAEPAAP